MSAKYESIQAVVSYFLDQYDKSIGDQDKAYLMAYRGLSNMHYNTIAEPKTVRLPVNANQTVYLPADYTAWVKIGILNNNGEVSVLRVNNALTTFRDDNANRLSLLTADVNDGWIGNRDAPFLNYFNNGIYAPLYGIGGGLVTFGDCRVDEKNNIIVLGTTFRYPHVILEYISCPEKDQEYMVDVRLREALVAFIAWKFNLDSRQNFYAAQVEARRMINPIKMQSFEQVIRENQKFCIKT